MRGARCENENKRIVFIKVLLHFPRILVTISENHLNLATARLSPNLQLRQTILTKSRLLDNQNIQAGFHF